LQDIISYHFDRPHWGHYQGTRLEHLARLEALSSPKLFVGGSRHAPNATTSSHGPSWRMVVEMHPDGPRGFGVLPGGQSGNPGNPGYLQSLKNWVNGQYHELHLLDAPDLKSDGWNLVSFTPKGSN
jgi:penicillin G amidase